MSEFRSCPIQPGPRVAEWIKKSESNDELKALRKEINGDLDQIPCNLGSRQSGGGYTLTAQQQVNVAKWAGRIYGAFKLTGYIWNIVDAASFQCDAPHFIAGWLGWGIVVIVLREQQS